MRSLFLTFAVIAFLTPAAFGQESVMERLARIESNNNAINAMIARQGADIANIQDDIKAIREKVDALAKLSGAQFTASTVDEWGRGKVASFSSPGQSMQMRATSSYSMSSGYSAPRRFAPVRRLLGGGCANGS